MAPASDVVSSQYQVPCEPRFRGSRMGRVTGSILAAALVLSCGLVIKAAGQGMFSYVDQRVRPIIHCERSGT